MKTTWAMQPPVCLDGPARGMDRKLLNRPTGIHARESHQLLPGGPAGPAAGAFGEASPPAWLGPPKPFPPALVRQAWPSG